MNFYPEPAPLPRTLETAEFHLEPLHPRHLELDYDAVMASRPMLNLWSGSTWPTADFTLAENLADLKVHFREHQDRDAFTFTILNPASDFCLGCLYIRSLFELVKYNPHQLQGLSEREAVARFWVRSSELGSKLETNLLQTLITWFEQEWRFKKLYFHTRVKNRQQSDLFDRSSLTFRFHLEIPSRGGEHSFWC